MPLRSTVTAALLTVQVLFAAHYVAAKWLLAVIPAPAWVALRVGGCALVLLVLTAGHWKSYPRDGRTLAQIALLSVFGVVLNQILFIEGLSRTVPSHSALINTSIPVTTLLFAVLLRKEALRAYKVVAVALALSGVLILLAEAGLDPARGTLTGDLMCLANATSFSLFLVLSRPVLQRWRATAVTPLLFLFGSVAVGLYGLPSLRSLAWGEVPAAVWWTAAGIVMGPTVGAYYLNNWALTRVESSRVALFIYLQFVLAAPLSWLLLDEKLSWRLVPAAGLVFAGLLVTAVKRSQTRIA